MRKVLFRIWLEKPWALWTDVANEPPHLGACWVLLGIAAAFLGYHALRRHWGVVRDRSNLMFFGGGLLVLTTLPLVAPDLLPKSLPAFGYGVMVMLGFLGALAFAARRSDQVGMPPDFAYDIAMWLLIPGVVGGRLAYLVQYRHEVFTNHETGLPMNIGEALFQAINLSEGGLVLIGALVGGGLGFFAYCWRHKMHSMDLADLLIPAVFIGIGFGRIGCLLNGCCFGDRCELPWAITFPADTLTFNMLAERGFVNPHALATIPLHPTQIYSSINGFILALTTAIYYWYRRHPGDGFALGCMLYAITRFQIEFLRSDEMGKLGTSLTISQFYAMGLFTLGLVIMLTGPWRAKRAARIPLPHATASS